MKKLRQFAYVLLGLDLPRPGFDDDRTPCWRRYDPDLDEWVSYPMTDEEQEETLARWAIR